MVTGLHDVHVVHPSTPLHPNHLNNPLQYIHLEIFNIIFRELHVMTNLKVDEGTATSYILYMKCRHRFPPRLIYRYCWSLSNNIGLRIYSPESPPAIPHSRFTPQSESCTLKYTGWNTLADEEKAYRNLSLFTKISMIREREYLKYLYTKKQYIYIQNYNLSKTN